MYAITRSAELSRPIINSLESIAPIGDLLIRLWVANVFWKSDVNKFQSFDITVQLFEYEYSVPFVSPTVAAYLGTGVELIFPVLLAIGLGAGPPQAYSSSSTSSRWSRIRNSTRQAGSSTPCGA